jgi:hypothetical protein
MSQNNRTVKDKIFNKQLIKRIGNLLTTVFKNKTLTTDYHLQQFVVSYSESITKRLESRGSKEAVAFYKSIHLIATKVAMGRPFKPLQFVKSDKLGRPRVIKFLIPFLVSENSDHKRMALSITKLYEAIIINPSEDFSSITEDNPTKELTGG